MKNSNKKNINCPVGLSLLATFSILAGVVSILSALLLIFFMIKDFTISASLIRILFLRLFTFLYFVAGIGYLKLKWYQGYILGNIIAAFSLLSIGISLALKESIGSELIQQIILKLIFPLITLLLLNLRYRKVFLKARILQKKEKLVSSPP